MNEKHILEEIRKCLTLQKPCALSLEKTVRPSSRSSSRKAPGGVNYR